MNLFNYIEKYKDMTFDKVKFNEIDNLIFSNIIYLNFTNIIEENVTLYEAFSLLMGKYKYNDIKKELSKKDAYDILLKIYDSKRYLNIILKDYVYIGNSSEQFSALTLIINKEYKYIVFEGTDNLLSGWKDDFKMAYKYPIHVHKYAIRYLSHAISIFDKNVIVGGHSKGGNLALVSSMNMNLIKRRKIVAIYNNDGPGLRLKEINSKKYQKIKDRYVHIIPDYSYIGILLRSDKDKIIKSSKKSILSHDMLYWKIDDKKLVKSNLSSISSRLRKNMLTWLDCHNDNDRKLIFESIFNALESAGIYYTRDMKNFKNIMLIIENLKNIDKDTKTLIMDFLEYNIKHLIYEKNDIK